MNSKQVNAAIFVGKKQKKRKIINQRGTVFPAKVLSIISMICQDHIGSKELMISKLK